LVGIGEKWPEVLRLEKVSLSDGTELSRAETVSSGIEAPFFACDSESGNEEQSRADG